MHNIYSPDVFYFYFRIFHSLDLLHNVVAGEQGCNKIINFSLMKRINRLTSVLLGIGRLKETKPGHCVTFLFIAYAG